MVIDGLGTENLVACPVIHLVESMEGAAEPQHRSEGLEQLISRMSAGWMAFAVEEDSEKGSEGSCSGEAADWEGGSQMGENLKMEELPQEETESVADDSGPETTEESESQMGDDPHKEYWAQGEDGLRVTASGLASGEEVGEDRQHEGQKEQPGEQDWQALSAEQHESMVEAMRDESLRQQCQEKAPSGSLFLDKEEKAAFAVAVARSLADEPALSMLVQSTVMAEAESRRQHKAEQKKQAQEKAEGIMAVQQWERDNPCPEERPQEVYSDCQLVTTGMQEASEAEAEKQEWHEVQDMPQEQVPRLFKWEQEKQAKQQKLQQKVGQVTVDQGQGHQTEGAA